MAYANAQNNPYGGVSGSNALDNDTAVKPHTLAPVVISILPRHISYFGESKDKERKANQATADRGYQTVAIPELATFARVMHQGVTWVSPIFKNGHRLQENFSSATTLVVEFDDVVVGQNDWQTLAPKTNVSSMV